MNCRGVGVLVLKMALPWVGVGKYKEEATWYSAWILEEHKAELFGKATLLDMCGRDNVCIHQPPFPFFLDTWPDCTSQPLLPLGRTM